MNSDGQEEAVDRLGGPSKIGKLGERVDLLEDRLKNLVTELEERVKQLAGCAEVEVGRTVLPGALGHWHDSTGAYHAALEVRCIIMGVGNDWVVIRVPDTGLLYFSTQTDIRSALLPYIL